MNGARILLLEDDRDIRWMLATLLRREGAEVTEAPDGVDGLDVLARQDVDLIVSDVCMPRLGGFGVLEAVRGDEMNRIRPTAGIPMMLMTGHVSRAELAKGLDAGVDDFVTKPVDPEEFVSRVRAVLRRARGTHVPTARTQGDLRDVSMSALTQAFFLACRTGRVQISAGKWSGCVDFQRGAVTHAVFEGPTSHWDGHAAALRILALDSGTFEFVEIPSSAPKSVFEDTQSLLLQAATLMDEDGPLSGIDESSSGSCEALTPEQKRAAVREALQRAAASLKSDA